MKNKYILTCILSLALMANILYAQDWLDLILESGGDRSGLKVNDKKKMTVIIEEISDEAGLIGLSKDRIKTKCELRFRQLGIKPIEKVESSEDGSLGIIITVSKEMFNVEIKYARWALYFVGSKKYVTFATVWSKWEAGLHRNNPEYILQSLDPLLDDFFNDFLKANPRQ